MDCADDATLKQIYNFVPTALDKACKLSIAGIPDLIKYVTGFIDTLPAKAKACLEADKDFIAL